MEGANVMVILNIPAVLIVLVGTLGASMAGTEFKHTKNIPVLYKKAFGGQELDLPGRVTELVGFAEQARREGLLALDEQLAEVDDDFTRKGLQLVVDGTDPDLVAEVLEQEVAGMRKRHADAASLFEKAGGFAPTMGIIGTVFGLINVLENLDAPETLGPMISAAFIATLLGVASANVVFLPISNRLKQLSAAEVDFRRMTIEGVLAIQAGDNPRIVAERLISYVPPEDRELAEDDDGGGGDAPATTEPAAADEQVAA